MSGEAAPLVVVMGVSGVGKSSVGRLLADRLGVEYADGDDFHSESNVAAMHSGRALTDDQRQPWLRAVAGWLRTHDAEGGVVSCSALRRSHRDVLVAAAPRATFLHLSGEPGLVRERMESRRHFMPASLLASQLATLEPPEEDERHLTCDVAASEEEIVEGFLAWCRS